MKKLKMSFRDQHTFKQWKDTVDTLNSCSDTIGECSELLGDLYNKLEELTVLMLEADPNRTKPLGDE